MIVGSDAERSEAERSVVSRKGYREPESETELSCLDYYKNNSQKNEGRSQKNEENEEDEGRSRHKKYLKANEIVNQKRFGWYQDKEAGWVNYIFALFKEYYSDIETKVLHFERYNDVEGKQEHFYKKYSTRFDKEYKNKLIKRFESLERFEKAVKVEITCDMSKFTNIQEAKDKLRKAQDKLIRALNERLGRTLEYLSSFEVYGDKTGTINPHLHLIFFGVNFLIHKSYIYEKMEKYGVGENVNIEKAVRFKDAVSYAVKHAVKNTIKSEDNADIRYMALLWALNARSWTVSKGLLEEPDFKAIFGEFDFRGLEFTIVGHKWEYTGLYYLSLFEKPPPLDTVCEIEPPKRDWEE